MVEPVYVTRDKIMRALDVKPSAYMHTEIDRACRSGSRAAEGLLHRVFYPERLTRVFDYPVPGGDTPGRIWFDERALVALEEVTSDGVTIPTSAVLGYPRTGPPYSRVDLDRATSYAFGGGPQGAVEMLGTWGYRDDEVLLGTLSGSLTDSATQVLLSVPAEVGAILRAGTERMIVTGKRWANSGITASAVAQDKASVTVTVSDGSVFAENETILLDSERMDVVDIAGNSLTVRRASGGSLLAAHSNGAAVWRQTTALVERGSLGTVAAAHSSAAEVMQWQAPSLVEELSQAYAEDAFLQRNAGYARTVGSGDSERQVSVRSIKAVEERAYALYGRKARMRYV